MTWNDALAPLGSPVATRQQLEALGATGRILTGAVRDGHLLRLRRGLYALPSTDPVTAAALRAGGRLGCVSALRHHGVFAFDDGLHIHLAPNASRLRTPHRRRSPASARHELTQHWRRLQRPEDGTPIAIGLLDALHQALLCQPAVVAMASIENAMFLGLVDEAEVRTLFGTVPGRLRPLLDWIDPRAEAGQETVLRRLVQEAGWNCEVQVVIPGVGRVDLLVEGVLILEADSRLAHEGWAAQVRDRRRDLAAARLGYATLRPAYEHTMRDPRSVVEAIDGILRTWGRRPRGS